MAEVQVPPSDGRDAWFRGHVLTRFFATVWWMVMVFITACVAVGVIDAAIHPSWRSLVKVAIAAVIAIPLVREWPNWRRMGRMLRHGT